MSEKVTAIGTGRAALAAAAAASSAHDVRAGRPRILLAATLRWPLAARLAIAFHQQGCPVEAWCPPGHPLERTRAAARVHAASVLRPLRSLRAAIRHAAPDFIIPCDDDAALHLLALHRSSAPADPLRLLLEHSLGTPASCGRAAARGEFMRLALAEGVRVPMTAPLQAPGDVDRWRAQDGGYPAVVKTDRSWGGLGVTVVRDPAEARAAAHAASHPSLLRALSHWVMRRDPAYLRRGLGGARRGVTIQSFIAGQAANRAVACWQGEVLAGISVVALQTHTPTGPACVVQVIEHAEMSEAARRLVRALGLSGLCGLDFILDAASNAAWLIEMNPRATPVCHLALGAGRDLPAALCARLTGAAAPNGPATIEGDVIALFPGEWHRNPRSTYLRSAFHDVPWAEAELVRDCVDRPWDERGVLARLRARFSGSRD